MKTLIAAAMLLALTTPARAAPEEEWFLIFDTWFCDVHDCGERLPGEDFVHMDTFTTRKHCLTAGSHLIFDTTIAPYVFAGETGSVIGKISPRCVRDH